MAVAQTLSYTGPRLRPRLAGNHAVYWFFADELLAGIKGDLPNCWIYWCAPRLELTWLSLVSDRSFFFRAIGR
jgi:hypothetical protein